MRFKIDTDIFLKESISLKEIPVLIYYILNNSGILNNEICHSLWEKNWLIKSENGYILNNSKIKLLEGLMAESATEESKRDKYVAIAEKMREVYPKGKKQGLPYYWRDSTKVIAQRLMMFFKKYGEDYTEENIVNATKKYVDSWHGNYQYMQLLKYFIMKKNPQGEDTSELLSYLENEGQTEQQEEDWMATLI